MNLKRLIAALSSVRAKLALIEALLEEGKVEEAIEQIDAAEGEWREAVEEARQ